MIEAEMEYNLTGLRELAKEYPDAVRKESTAVLELIVARLEAEVVERTPAGVGGAAGLRGSIHGEVASTGGMPVRGTVGTPLEHGIVVELGRTPGKAMPPVGPLELWVQRKLGVDAEEARAVAFAVAVKIARSGFEGAHMFRDAWEANERWVDGQLRSIYERVLERLERI